MDVYKESESAILPEVLDIPVAQEPVPVRLPSGMELDANMLARALAVEVGQHLAAIALDSGRRTIVAEYAKPPKWLDASAVFAAISRVGEDHWSVRVGEHTHAVSRADIVGLMVAAFTGQANQPPAA